MSITGKQFTAEELIKINEADDLKISPLRADGQTYGTPTWIWEVAVNGELYVRAYSGISSSWYKSAVAQKAGRIHAAGMVKEVAFEPVLNPEINKRIDEAYRKKYSNSPYVAPMISSRAKAATIRVTLK